MIDAKAKVCVQNSNANLRGFLAQNPWTTLHVSTLVSLYVCRSASPEILSARIVERKYVLILRMQLYETKYALLHRGKI